MNQAVIICVMDVSGSVVSEKKNLFKKYFYMFKGIVEGRYERVDCKFIAHTKDSKQVNDLSSLVNCSMPDATYLSSGSNLALNIIESEINTSKVDIFTIMFSDGDNCRDDNPKFAASVNELCKKCIDVQFIEAKLVEYETEVFGALEERIRATNFNIRKISNENDIIQTMTEAFNKNFKRNTFVDMDARDKERIKGNVARVTRGSRATTVELTDGSVGIAFCTAFDVYDADLGFEIAKTRAEICSKKQELDKLLTKRDE